MTRETSLKAYFNEVEPTLQAREMQVLEVFERDEELTNGEINSRLGWTINRVTPRVNRLCKEIPGERPAILEEARKRPCRITGRTAIAWRVKSPPGTAFVPVRELKNENVPAPNFYQFESKSRFPQTYRVVERDGNIGCTCPGFRYRATCSHVKKVQEDAHRRSMASLFS